MWQKFICVFSMGLMMTTACAQSINFTQNQDDTIRLKGHPEFIKITRNHQVRGLKDKTHRPVALNSYKLFNKNGKLIEEGRIKKNQRIKENTFQFDDRGNLVKQEHFDAQGSPVWKQIGKYNDDGQRQQMLRYDREGLVWKQVSKFNEKGEKIEMGGFIGNEYHKATTYSYDDRGNKIEIDQFDENGGLKSKVTVAYDENNNRIALKDFNGNGQLKNKILFTYDADDRLVKQETYGRDGVLGFVEVFKYNDKGLKTEKEKKNARGVVLQKKTITYNAHKQKMEISLFNGKDRLVGQRNFEYNENNLLIKEVKKTGDDYRTETQYQYDEQGNWVKQTHLENGKTMLVIKRSIRYFGQ